MAWSENLLINPSAETQNTTGWVVSVWGTIDDVVPYGPIVDDRISWNEDTQHLLMYLIPSVAVGENYVEETQYLPIVDDRETLCIQNQHIFSLEGLDGTYSFAMALSGDSEMYQLLSAEAIGIQPTSFQLIFNYRILKAQEAWDNSVLGRVFLQIVYTDGTKDTFTIPCIKGVTHTDRTLPNFWLRVYAVCEVNSEKILDYVKVFAKASSFTQGLYIDMIELRKEE